MATYRSIRALKVIRHDGQDHQPGTDNQDLVVRSEQAAALVSLNAAMDLGPAPAPVKQGDVSGWYREGLLVWLDDGQGGPIMLGAVGGGEDGTVPMVVDGVVTWVPVASVIQQALGSISLYPTTAPDIASTTEDTPLSGNVLTNDTTVTGNLYITKYTLPTMYGVVTYSAGVQSTTNPFGTFILRADGSWNMTPRANLDWNLPLITYTVSNGLAESTGTLKINVSPVNDAPRVGEDILTGLINNSIDVYLLGNDNDIEGNPISVTHINGTAVVDGTVVSITNATVTFHADQTVTVTPNAGFTGGVDFAYTVSDGLLSTNGNVHVTFTPIPVTNGTSNFLVSTTTTIDFDWAANTLDKMQIVTEPVTGATIRRLTNVNQDMLGRVALYNAYSRYPCENINGRFVIAFADNSTSSLIMDRETGAIVAALAYDNTGLGTHSIGCYHEIRWHYMLDHPYRVYYMRGQQFWMIDDVRDQANTRTMIKDFSTVLDWTGTPDGVSRQVYMDQEGNSSLDSDHWAWMAAYYDGSTWIVRAYIHYQISTDTVHIMYPSGIAGFPNAPANEEQRTTFLHRPNMIEVAPDGSGIVIGHPRAYAGFQDAYMSSAFEAPYFWPIDFNPATFTPFRIACEASHSGWTSKDGTWYYIHGDTRRDMWCGAPISGPNRGYGNENQLDVATALSPGVIDFHHDGGIYPGYHFGVCTNEADGWVFVSTYAVQSIKSNGLANTLHMMKLVPEGPLSVKWMVAPACNQTPGGLKADYNEAPASINLAGTRLITPGDWNGTSALHPTLGERYVDMYEVALPTNWKSVFEPNAPAQLSAPTVSGTAQQGHTLTAVDATFTGFPAPTVSGIWQRDGVDIAGVTALTYNQSGADVGHMLRRRTRGANASGYVDVYSPAVGPVVSLPVPAVITSPSISGLAQQGSVLTGDDGTYTNAPTSFARQWYRRHPSTLALTAIAGATATTYTPVTADIGYELVYDVTPSNAYGAGETQHSAATAVVVADPGSITRVAEAVSTDPSPGTNVLTRNSAGFDVQAGDLIVVSIDWNTNAGTNASVTVADTLVSAFTAGSVAAHTGLYGRCQQFWAVASANQIGNVVTATNAGTSTPLNVSVAVYRASSGTTWTHMDEKTLETDYVANPLSLPAVDMPSNSLAVAHWHQPYSISGAIATSDTVVHTSNGVSWTTERIRGNSALAQVLSASDAGRDYTRMAASVQVFQRT